MPNVELSVNSTELETTTDEFLPPLTATIADTDNDDVNEECSSCGTPKPSGNAGKVFECPKCRRYVCSFKGCRYTNARPKSVAAHYRAHRIRKVDITNQGYKYCICGQEKIFNEGRELQICPSRNCKYIWCRYCLKEFKAIKPARSHVSSCVMAKVTDACWVCKLAALTKGSGMLRGQCSICLWHWCFIDGCKTSYPDMKSLNEHQETHKFKTKI